MIFRAIVVGVLNIFMAVGANSKTGRCNLTLDLKVECKQDEFGKIDSTGACLGISFMFCVSAFKSGAEPALHTMKKAPPTEKINDLMLHQQSVLVGLNGAYLKDDEGKPISDIKSKAGVENQKTAINARHTAFEQKARESGMKADKTSSTIRRTFSHLSFSEFIQKKILDKFTTGKVAAIMGFAGGGKGHAVALFYDGANIYFFDSNFGLYKVVGTAEQVRTDIAKFIDDQYPALSSYAVVHLYSV